jgi:ATP-dependent DNA ligase
MRVCRARSCQYSACKSRSRSAIPAILSSVGNLIKERARGSKTDCRWHRKKRRDAYVGRMFKSFEFCLPTAATAVPSGPDWLHEVKYDGYRLRLEMVIVSA